MRRRSLTVRTLAALVLGLLALSLLAACGDDDDDGGGGGGGDSGTGTEEYATSYRPINNGFVALGEQVATTIQTAEGQTDAALAAKFGDQANKVGQFKQRLSDLEPPAEYRADHDKLIQAMGVVQADLQAVADAARRHDAEGAKTAVQKLVKDSENVRTPRRALAEKTGARKE